MKRDKAADVLGVSLAEAVEDLVVQLLKLTSDLFDLLRRKTLKRMRSRHPVEVVPTRPWALTQAST
jgi:hypothetical protein